MSEKSLSFPQVGPNLPINSEFKGQNGVTYTWTPEYSTWMIGSTQQVNKDYVDSKDQLRVRTDGGNHHFANLVFRDTADEFSAIGLELQNTGSIVLHNNKNITFVGDGGSISVTQTKFLTFENSTVGVKKTIQYEPTLNTLQKITVNQNKTVKLFDCESTTNVTLDVDIASGSSAKFRITKNGSNIMSVGANGQVYLSGGSSDTIFNASSKFYVKKNGDVVTTSAYNDRLISSTNSTISVVDESVATKGYVDANSTQPGVAVVATKEADAQVNGFWRNGNNLYLRIS